MEKSKLPPPVPEAGPTFGWIVYISRKYGWDYFDKLHANDAIVAPSSDETVPCWRRVNDRSRL